MEKGLAGVRRTPGVRIPKMGRGTVSFPDNGVFATVVLQGGLRVYFFFLKKGHCDAIQIALQWNSNRMLMQFGLHRHEIFNRCGRFCKKLITRLIQNHFGSVGLGLTYCKFFIFLIFRDVPPLSSFFKRKGAKRQRICRFFLFLLRCSIGRRSSEIMLRITGLHFGRGLI